MGSPEKRPETDGTGPTRWRTEIYAAGEICQYRRREHQRDPLHLPEPPKRVSQATTQVAQYCAAQSTRAMGEHESQRTSNQRLHSERRLLRFSALGLILADNAAHQHLLLQSETTDLERRRDQRTQGVRCPSKQSPGPTPPVSAGQVAASAPPGGVGRRRAAEDWVPRSSHRGNELLKARDFLRVLAKVTLAILVCRFLARDFSRMGTTPGGAAPGARLTRNGSGCFDSRCKSM